MVRNVIIIVLDTLREDYSRDLSKLEELGFTRYENCIATSPWTLPSHVSLFTGKMPSQHAIHESLDVHVSNIFKLFNQNLSQQNAGLLGKLRRRGYTTYCLSCNAMVSPMLGFPFDESRVFGAEGDLFEAEKYQSGSSRLSKLFRMVHDRKLGLLYRTIARKELFLRLLRPSTVEKGSKFCINSLASTNFKQPFFLFVNYLDAHEPYSWRDYFRVNEIAFNNICNYPNDSLDWRKKYPVHSKHGISRVFETLELLQPFLENSLVIVTSDHGQLLGEDGRYGHGFFLDDELLKVPLYVKFPLGVRDVVQQRPFISLSSIPILIESVLYGINFKFGSTYALAENFGPEYDLKPRSEGDADKIKRSFGHKVRVFSAQGGGILNLTTNSVSDLSGKMDSKTIQEIVSESVSTKRIVLDA